MASTVKNNDKGGKRPGQKYKSLLVWNLLLKRTDENHAISIKDIRTHLEAYGIQTERHSISRDINDLTELLARDQELVDDLEERDLLGYPASQVTRSGAYLLIRPASFTRWLLLVCPFPSFNFSSSPY